MQTEKILARLTAKGIGVPTGEQTGGGGGGSVIDQAAVAGALAGLSPAAYWFARARFLDDPEHARLLWDWVTATVTTHASAGNWGEIPHPQARRIALVAMTPSVWGIRCPICDGRGQHNRRRGVLTTCGACHGSGRGVVSEREQARIVGVPATSWRRIWRPRVAAVARLVADLETEVDEHVRRQFR